MLTSEIKKMPVKDRIILMEKIWESLSYREEKIDSPEWHKKILAERKKMLHNRKTKFITIDELKS